MFDEIKIYLLLFLFYSIFGWIIEVVRCYFKYGRFINRGILIGSYLPIYGFGSIILYIVYNVLSKYIFLVFIVSIIIAALLEYMTSFFLEKIFNARWWDYSDRRLNLNGRICAENLIEFGVFSLLVLYIINPLYLNLVFKINESVLNILLIIFLVSITLDFIISFIVLKNIKKTTNEENSDNTEEVHKLVVETIKNKSWIYRRLINAYPYFKYFISISDSKIRSILNSNDTKKVKKIKIRAVIEKENLKKKYKMMANMINDKENKKLNKLKKKDKK